MKKHVTLEQEDINALHDVILEALEYPNEDITDEIILNCWKNLPEHIKEDAIHWGLDDTVVRDNIYVWLQENK